MRSRPGVIFSSLLLLFLAATPLQGQQGTVTGRVTDSESGRPLQSAQVSILGSEGRGGLTDAQGIFRVTVAPGTYAVAVQLIGYADARRDGVSVPAGGTVTVDVALDSRATVLNPIVVTASRREEKALESPSTVVTIGQEAIAERTAVSPADHVKGLPGVDVTQTGLSQSNIVTRGFNNVFSGALLVITDNRYARVPSLRFNAYNMIPLAQSDIERMEVLLGPAAALYGPNSASGVLHIITTSPLDEQGSTVAVAGGERELFQGEFRTAFTTSENTGLKLSGTYQRGEDWNFVDPAEERERQQLIDAGEDPGLIGLRDFDQERFSFDGRFDWRPGDDTEVIVNGGLNSIGSSVELTGLGAGQARDWAYSYLQSRFRSGRFFAQAFLNKSDAGETFLLRTGMPIVDESELWAAQVQHGFDLGDRQDFIYGVDAAFTRPKTGGTITGRNEDDDDINELGAYVQSQTALSDQLDFIAALRVDDHNRLEDLNWSPRAALSFHPTEDQNFRLTYNRAFSTPTTNNLFLDLVAGRIPLGGGVGYDIRTLGVPSGGFSFGDTCQGGFQDLCMYSPFNPGNQMPANGLPLWNGIVQAVVPAQLQPALLNPGAGPGDPNVLSLLRRFNQESAQSGGDPFLIDPDGPSDIAPISSTTYNTFEVGYKGILGGRLLVAADVYSQNIQDFVGPLRVETPSVFYNPASVRDFVLHRLGPLIQAGVVTQEQAGAIIEGISRIPLGTVAPDGVESSDLILTYRNFGDVDLWGADLALQLLASDNLSFTGSYAHVSDECFDFNEDGSCFSATDVALNAPRNKGSVGVRWEDKLRGLMVESRARFVEGFPMNSGVYVGTVDGYGVVDANIQYRIPNWSGASVTLTAYNLLDNEHQEFVGAPEIGRLLLLRLKYDF